MEMLIVVAIIVALAGIGGYYLLGAGEDAKKGAAQAQVKGPLTQAVKTYKLKHGQWPQSLDVLLNKDAKGGPYLETQDALTDPWSQKYQYDVTGSMNSAANPNIHTPDIWTVHPDSQEKIGNWAITNR